MVYQQVPDRICEFNQGVVILILAQAVPTGRWNIKVFKLPPIINAQQVISHIIKVSVAPDWMTGYYGDSNLSNLKGLNNGNIYTLYLIEIIFEGAPILLCV
jgi:hypothetical protein